MDDDVVASWRRGLSYDTFAGTCGVHYSEEGRACIFCVYSDPEMLAIVKWPMPQAPLSLVRRPGVLLLDVAFVVMHVSRCRACACTSRKGGDG